MKRPKGERLYSCNKCEESFCTDRDMKRQIRIHEVKSLDLMCNKGNLNSYISNIICRNHQQVW